MHVFGSLLLFRRFDWGGWEEDLSHNQCFAGVCTTSAVVPHANAQEGFWVVFDEDYLLTVVYVYVHDVNNEMLRLWDLHTVFWWSVGYCTVQPDEASN